MVRAGSKAMAVVRLGVSVRVSVGVTARRGWGVALEPLVAFVSKGVGGGKGVAARVRVGVRLGAGGGR